VDRNNGHRAGERQSDIARYQRENPMEQPFIVRPLPIAGTRVQEIKTPPAWTPLVEVFEVADSIRIVAELPGVRLRDVSVSLEGQRLTISGTKAQSEVEPTVRVLRHERSYGGFRLNATVDFANVTAACELGVLTVTLPKAESAKRHQIAVEG
jgi:HSP20 family molecular chaperone IbpA